MNTEKNQPGTSRPTAHRSPSTNRGTAQRAARPTHRSRRPSRATNPFGPPLVTTAKTSRSAGTYRPHPRGFGFVELETPLAAPDGTELTSCFIPPPLAEGLLEGDTVGVTVDTADGRATATSATVLHRARTEIFGVLADTDTGLTVRVDPHVGHGTWRATGISPRAGAQAVTATITGPGVAAVTKVHGAPLSASALRTRVLTRHQVTVEYPGDVLEHAARIVDGTEPVPAVSRTDLSELTTITIDAASSRDLDDALSARVNDDGSITVWVHIADVTAHVQPGTPVDREAARTGTSVYLPSWNRPMIPPTLSEYALSLLPGVERDTLTVQLRVAEDGSVSTEDVCASRIRSLTRVTYLDAAALLAGRAPKENLPAAARDLVRTLAGAAQRLSLSRAGRGGIDANRAEPALTVGVDVDADRVSVTPAEPSNEAHLLVERLMVAANEAVAGWLLERNLPALFRTHAQPDASSTAKLVAFCAQVGLPLDLTGPLTPAAAAQLAAHVGGASQQVQSGLWQVLMSELGRAEYTPVAGLHFGLASPAYLHFTSPIRRYADMVVHRAVHAHLAGDTTLLASGPELADVAAAVNAGAGVAARVEAQARKAMWLTHLRSEANRTGRAPAMAAVVSGVSGKGVHATLVDSGVTGLIALRDLPGRWDVDESGFSIRCQDGRSLTLGEPVQVRVRRADVEGGQLDLAHADAPVPSRVRNSGRDASRGSVRGDRRRRAA